MDLAQATPLGVPSLLPPFMARRFSKVQQQFQTFSRRSLFKCMPCVSSELAWKILTQDSPGNTFPPQKTSVTQHLCSTSSLKLPYSENINPGKSPEVLPVSHKVYRKRILHEPKNEHKGWHWELTTPFPLKSMSMSLPLRPTSSKQEKSGVYSKNHLTPQQWKKVERF